MFPPLEADLLECATQLHYFQRTFSSLALMFAKGGTMNVLCYILLVQTPLSSNIRGVKEQMFFFHYFHYLFVPCNASPTTPYLNPEKRIIQPFLGLFRSKTAYRIQSRMKLVLNSG